MSPVLCSSSEREDQLHSRPPNGSSEDSLNRKGSRRLTHLFRAVRQTRYGMGGKPAPSNILQPISARISTTSLHCQTTPSALLTTATRRQIRWLPTPTRHSGSLRSLSWPKKDVFCRPVCVTLPACRAHPKRRQVNSTTRLSARRRLIGQPSRISKTACTFQMGVRLPRIWTIRSG